MRKAGYAHLIDQYSIPATKPEISIEVATVTRKEALGNTLLVPSKMAPAPEDLLGHVVFALKHEGMNLQVLAQVLPLIPEFDIRCAFDSSPNSQYLRKACFLWEHFSGRLIQRAVQNIRQSYVPLFDSSRYITGPGIKNPRWRVTFNGLGSLDYCVTVRRTKPIESLLKQDVLQRGELFFKSLPQSVADRTLAWAYWNETWDSWAIENESPAEGKAVRFVNLLKKARYRDRLDESFLVAIQNDLVSNALVRSMAFRTEQNYLSNGLPGSLGVTYVPPDPTLARQLMDELMAMANAYPSHVDTLVLASIVSLGFVFIHPFMDGNGRLSRFLFHQVLCLQGALDDRLFVPVSSVLRRNENEYLEALKTFSGPVTRFWKVKSQADSGLALAFHGHPALYRYWDATSGVEFMMNATKHAIDQDLKRETVFLKHYDEIYRRIDRAFDVANMDLTRLVRFCLEQNGQISGDRRKQFEHKVPPEVFDALEQAYQAVMRNRAEG